MTEPNRYAVALDELVAGARVPAADQIEEVDVSETALPDESVGHLPGNVRPYGA